MARILHWTSGRRTGWVHAFCQMKQWIQTRLSALRHVRHEDHHCDRPAFKLDEMRHAIAQLGVQGVTVTEVYEAEYGPRAKVEIAVDDSIVEPVLEAIANISRTGRNGDGKILVGKLGTSHSDPHRRDRNSGNLRTAGSRNMRIDLASIKSSRWTQGALLASLALLPVLAGAADAPAPVPNKGDTAWMIVATLLVLMMAVPGLALFYGGMVRAKNVLSTFMQVFVIFSVCTVLWVIYVTASPSTAPVRSSVTSAESCWGGSLPTPTPRHSPQVS